MEAQAEDLRRKEEREQKQKELQEKMKQAEEKETERQRKNQDKIDFIEFKKTEVGEEPDASAEGVCEIKFREPHSGKSFNRRFMKDDTIAKAYDFVASKLDEIVCIGQ